jgi:hypothetical protein
MFTTIVRYEKMQTGKKEVRTGVKVKGQDGKETTERRLVGYAEYEIFETLDEAVQLFGEDKCVELINTQHCTNEMNKMRASVSDRTSKKALLEEAQKRICNDPSLLQQCAGKPERFAELVEEIMEQVKAEKSNVVGSAASVEEEDED